VKIVVLMCTDLATSKCYTGFDNGDCAVKLYLMRCGYVWQLAATTTATSVRLPPATRANLVTSRTTTESARVSHLLVLRIQSLLYFPVIHVHLFSRFTVCSTGIPYV